MKEYITFLIVLALTLIKINADVIVPTWLMITLLVILVIQIGWSIIDSIMKFRRWQLKK